MEPFGLRIHSSCFGGSDLCLPLEVFGLRHTFLMYSCQCMQCDKECCRLRLGHFEPRGVWTSALLLRIQMSLAN